MELLGNDMSSYRQIVRQNLSKYGYLYQLPLSIYLAKEMISCVEYVHSKGYVHRDIKPANFVRRNNENNCHCYCIVDFGIAKQVCLSLSLSVSLRLSLTLFVSLSLSHSC
jgi:serine/threonine protein kinase